MKNLLIRIVEILDTIGFCLIVGSVVYFIIGTVAGVVHLGMLEVTFCEAAHQLVGVEWCSIEGTTSEHWFNEFIHRLINATLPWFAMFWGVVLVCSSSFFLKVLEFKYSYSSKR